MRVPRTRSRSARRGLLTLEPDCASALVAPVASLPLILGPLYAAVVAICCAVRYFPLLSVAVSMLRCYNRCYIPLHLVTVLPTQRGTPPGGCPTLCAPSTHKTHPARAIRAHAYGLRGGRRPPRRVPTRSLPPPVARGMGRRATHPTSWVWVRRVMARRPTRPEKSRNGQGSPPSPTSDGPWRPPTQTLPDSDPGMSIRGPAVAEGMYEVWKPVATSDSVGEDTPTGTWGAGDTPPSSTGSPS